MRYAELEWSVDDERLCVEPAQSLGNTQAWNHDPLDGSGIAVHEDDLSFGLGEIDTDDRNVLSVERPGRWQVRAPGGHQRRPHNLAFSLGQFAFTSAVGVRDDEGFLMHARTTESST